MNVSQITELVSHVLPSFFTLSYPLPRPERPDSFPTSNYYGKGYLDACFVLAWIGVLAFLRELLRLGVFEPFARSVLYRKDLKERKLKASTNGVVAVNGVSHVNGHNGHASPAKVVPKPHLPPKLKGSNPSKQIVNKRPKGMSKVEWKRERSTLRFAEQETSMSSWLSYITGRKDTKIATRDAIVGLRQQLTMLEKKEDHLKKKIDDETKTAKANAVNNKSVALAALRRKKANEDQLDKISGQRLQLETQINTIESANLNAETMLAMRKGADALKAIHGNLTIERVDATIEAINAQREIANEISEAISNPLTAGITLDEASIKLFSQYYSRLTNCHDQDDLNRELADLEADALTETLTGAGRVPIHSPMGPSKVAAEPIAEEDDEAAQLERLQAALTM
ncbi:hypothetical protein Clacol_001798 [Clathrus columnatus]|uniref:Vacuolar-sorting protein SNF7 n=1 Tax=Clathrus columnatus TaxID=1419009 RepID=A0AAV5A3L1_9AGAM|nr:hypothetical protein Clacol_001798 [Clathrus columnatus]